MAAKVEPGRTYQSQTRVEEWMTAEKAGNKGVDVLSPPMLLQLIEDAAVTEVLGRLRQIGVRISIDDFGTKYSSLSYLTRLNIDELKIDQSFIDGLADDDSKRAIVSAILAIGSALGIPVTAEGVETEAQLVTLRHLGCETVQGFYFARPLSAEECLAALRRPTVEMPTP